MRCRYVSKNEKKKNTHTQSMPIQMREEKKNMAQRKGVKAKSRVE